MSDRIEFKRGDIIRVDLRGAVGVEKKNDKTARSRPAVVVQNNVGNAKSPMVIVAPLNDIRQYKGYPVQERVYKDELEFADSKPSVVECGQLRTLDRSRRVCARLGKLSDAAMKRVDKALAVSVGLHEGSDAQD